MRILVLEDDPALSEGLSIGLASLGATPELVSSCADARAAVAANTFDTMIFDLNLPDGSGLELLAELRAGGNSTPALMLTAQNRPADRIKGLDAGADDYLGKPFRLDELAARLRAIRRRNGGRATAVLSYNGVALDPARMSVTANSETFNLSRREFALLAALMDRPGVIISKQDIESRLYGWQEEIESNSVEVHIHRLRAKIGSLKIETVRGVGYRMRPGAL